MAKKIARTTANQLEYSKAVRAAIEVSGEDVARKAEGVLFKNRKKKLDLVQLVGSIEELVREAEDELERAAATHADELADDDPLREERDQAKQELGEGLARTKSLLAGALGSGFVKRVGLHVALEERPDLLRKIGAGAVRLLRKSKAPAKAIAGVKLDLNGIADEIEAKTERLAGLLESLKREEREAQQTMVARDQATARWSDVLTFGGAVFEGLARIAGEHQIADRVRPTERRRVGIADETETDTDATDVEGTDTDASDTDTDDTDATS